MTNLSIEQVIAAVPDWAGRIGRLNGYRQGSPTRIGGSTSTARRISFGSGGRIRSCSPWIGGTRSTTRRRRPEPALRHGSSRPCPIGTSSRSSGSMPGRCRTRRCARAGCRRGSRRSFGSSTPGRGSGTTSTCSAPPSGTSPWSTNGRSRSRPAIGSTSDILPRIEAALDVQPLATVPCHNDLLAENYLDDGARLWLVDWEYSGNNDPDVRARQHRPGARLRRRPIGALCAAYFGEASLALLARMRLQIVMSDVGWTALGSHPGPHLDDRVRLHRLGRGTLGAGGDGARWAGVRGVARGGAGSRGYFRQYRAFDLARCPALSLVSNCDRPGGQCAGAFALATGWPEITPRRGSPRFRAARRHTPSPRRPPRSASQP